MQNGSCLKTVRGAHLQFKMLITNAYHVPQGYGVGGSNATCISIGPKAGGLTLACRECSQSGYQPFKGASALEFWIRDQNGSSTIPDVQVGCCCTDVDCVSQQFARHFSYALDNSMADLLWVRRLVSMPLLSTRLLKEDWASTSWLPSAACCGIYCIDS